MNKFDQESCQARVQVWESGEGEGGVGGGAGQDEGHCQQDRADQETVPAAGKARHSSISR